mmetsp:Transcript_10659/g.12820  ORF Transcript_10659/g.12820 Transcript_10659/m.12820 type:complete len:267 (+) Transcript_10659:158-958(+)
MTLVSSTLRVCLGNVDNTNLPSTDAHIISIDSLSSSLPAGDEGNIAPSSIDSLEVYVLVNELATAYDPMSLSDWIPKLKVNASVSIHAVVDGHEDDDKKIDLQPIHTSFLLAGLAGASEQKSPKGRIVTATRKVKESTAAILPPKKNIVTLSLDDDGDEDDLIDEDELLDDEVAPPPALLAEGKNAADDCGGRKACDNCTCGRAELEANGKKADAATEPTNKTVPSSACGNCAKGDAFRCAGCPFLGKPAFKAGEEHLVLDLTDDL